MILVPLTFNLNSRRMKPRKEQPDPETADRNRQEPHDPVQAGRQAIEASKLNEKEKPAETQQEEEKQDAEQWRNEG